MCTPGDCSPRQVCSLVAALALGGCIESGPRAGLTTHWQHARALAAAAATPLDREIRQASRGDAAAVHACFERTIARMRTRLVLAGEDIMELNAEMEFLFYSLGDRRFAEALRRESASTRNAVREFLALGRLETTTERTRAVFAGTPQVDYPAKAITREEFTRP